MVEVKELFSYPLKNYLERDRKLNLGIYKKYVKEIVYKHIEKNITFYGVGFKSGDTWVIRRNGFKGFLGKGIDITIFNYKTDKILLFEGFIDFLSYLTAKKAYEPLNTCIILNSAVQVKKVVKYANSTPHIKTIDYFRDRDEAGMQTLKQLEKELKSVTIRDMSNTYPNHKDLNEWLTNEHTRA